MRRWTIITDIKIYIFIRFSVNQIHNLLILPRHLLFFSLFVPINIEWLIDWMTELMGITSTGDTILKKIYPILYLKSGTKRSTHFVRNIHYNNFKQFFSKTVYFFNKSGRYWVNHEIVFFVTPSKILAKHRSKVHPEIFSNFSSEQCFYSLYYFRFTY